MKKQQDIQIEKDKLFILKKAYDARPNLITLNYATHFSIPRNASINRCSFALQYLIENHLVTRLGKGSDVDMTVKITEKGIAYVNELNKKWYQKVANMMGKKSLWIVSVCLTAAITALISILFSHAGLG